MKKSILVFLSVLFLLSGCTFQENEAVTQPFTQKDNETYVKAVWITYYELYDMIGDKSEEEFVNSANEAFKELYSMGFNTVCVQVRAFADAFYNSEYFPVSKYCFGKEGSELKYDVLKILCTAAKDNNLRLEAWINPYRVSFDKDIENLSDNNIAKKWYKNSKKKSNVYICKSGVYFNPASEEVKKLIINGAVEIAKNYDIQAIHFDDYFYPENSSDIDSAEYKKYKSKGGKKSLSDFRRENVSDMIKSVNKAIESINSNIRFGISPAANIKSDYNDLYADVESWAREGEYCDYICPQVYFGFKNVYQPFMFTVKKWVEITDKDLHIGLPLYKAGKTDKYAAQNDKAAINEFKNAENIIARQINYLAKIDDIKGFYVFSYSSLFDESKAKEVENMLIAIQSTHPN